MVAVDVKNPVELRAAGIRVLNEGLGIDAARMFIKQYFGGSGDYTAEKQSRPDMTPEEHADVMEIIKADAIKMGTWE